MIFTRIAVSAKTVIFTKTAILASSMQAIEFCCFGVKLRCGDGRQPRQATGPFLRAGTPVSGGTQIAGQEMTCRGGGFLAFSLEIMIFTRIAVSAKTVISTTTAILASSMRTIEIFCFGVKRTMPGPGMRGIIDIS